MKKIFTLLFIALLGNFSVQAQQRILPKGFAPGEAALIPAYNELNAQRGPTGISSPPNSPVRTMAEWEEVQAIVITWSGFNSILADIVRYARLECEVIIVCSNENAVKNYLGNAGVDWSSNVSFIEDEYDSIWVRDYGPNTVYTNDVDSLLLVDWIYNRPRYDDDKVSDVVGNFMGLPVYSTDNGAAGTDLVHTGGNFMADGLGQAFSSELVLEENGPFNQFGSSNHSNAEVDEIMDSFMGIESYPKMTVLPYDGIHHIDMHMKLLDEETLIVGQYPTNVADGPQIEANIQYVLENYTTKAGNQHKVIRIPMPPDFNGAYPNTNGDYRTYTNALFVNKTILIPVYQEQYDTTALNIWRAAMPGYNVQGINCNTIIPYGGAIHCITKEVGVSNPLWIAHARVRSALPDVMIPITATIKHKEGIEQAKLFYAVGAPENFTEVAMTYDGGTAEWTGMIPGQEGSAKVYYYIYGKANDGKEQLRPMPAPEAYFDIQIDPYIVSTTDVDAVESRIGEVFPNPAGAMTCIPVVAERTTPARIVLKDLYGRQLTTIFTGQLQKGESKHFIDVQTLPAGTYLIALETDKDVAVKKLTVK
ncbi:MAG: agmatine deiminase family protein [Saprospiraceae bacterium]